MSCIFLKANNAQQSSGGCARFNVRLKSYLVLISNFNSTNEWHINLYTWHISHATYKFLLLALTWDLITPNRQSILRDTRTVFSLPPVIVSLRIEHWCFILCQYKTNAGSSLAMPRVRCKQLSEATMETAVEKPGDACGLHVESLTRNESTCACPARSYWAMTSMRERKSKGCASVPKHFYIF